MISLEVGQKFKARRSCLPFFYRGQIIQVTQVDDWMDGRLLYTLFCADTGKSAPWVENKSMLDWFDIPRHVWQKGHPLTAIFK